MIYPLVCSAVIVVVDQLSKHLVRTLVTLHKSIPVFGSFFQLTYIENSGMAFGINFAGGPAIVTAAAIVASVFIIWYLRKVRERELTLRLSLALILGGAVGNLIDRVLFGRVVDFFDFQIMGYHWPIFNVADSSVTIGMILFLWVSLWKSPSLEAKRS